MNSTIAEPVESLQVEEIESLVTRTSDHCIPSSPVAAANNTVVSKHELVHGSSRNLTYRWPDTNLSVSTQPNSINIQASMTSSMTSVNEKGPNNSLSQNLSVLPSSMYIPSAPPEGSSLCTSMDQNQSVQPSSINIPSGLAPSGDTSQQQTVQHRDPAVHQQPEAVRTQAQMQRQQQVREIKQNYPQQNPACASERHSQGGAAITAKTGPLYTSMQLSDNNPAPAEGGRKKVFILHSIPENTPQRDALLDFATALRNYAIDVSIDLFEQDKTSDNWSMWYEREILSSNVVLCIITPDFYKNITEHDPIKGYAIYNLMSDPTKDIAFRAVFLDATKKMEYIPLSMRGATCYCISSADLSVPGNDELTNLYAFLSGQNRIEKPKLGNVIKLAPKKSRFGQSRTQHAPMNRNNVYQQRSPINAPQPRAAVSNERNEQAKLMFDLLSKDTTQVKSLRSNHMFATLATNLSAEWELLARMLEIGENNVHAIRSDYRGSVKEQAIQMFHKWLDINGSSATLGVLTRAVYESGPPYYNLLDVLNKYAPKL